MKLRCPCVGGHLSEYAIQSAVAGKAQWCKCLLLTLNPIAHNRTLTKTLSSLCLDLHHSAIVNPATGEMPPQQEKG